MSHVANKYGAGRSLLALIDGLTGKGVTCGVVLPGEGPLVAELTKREIQHAVIPLKRWASRETWLGRRLLRGCFNVVMSALIALRAQSWEADVIYTNSSVTPVGALAALLARKTHIWHVREFGHEDFGLSFDLGFENTARVMAKLSFQVIVVSRALRAKYSEHVCADKLKVVYNPAGAKAEARFLDQAVSEASDARSADPYVAAVVGRVQASKGQMDAVLAVVELRRRGIEVKLRIVGDGELQYLDQLRQVVVREGIAEDVEFTGFVDDALPVMQAADVVLVCSRSEAFGRVTVEALLSGTPVIGTDAGATPELVREGFNGLLYKPGDHHHLAQCIRYLIDHPDAAQRMGQDGFRWAARRFTVERCASQVLDTLQAAINKDKSHSR